MCSILFYRKILLSKLCYRLPAVLSKGYRFVCYPILISLEGKRGKNWSVLVLLLNHINFCSGSWLVLRNLFTVSFWTDHY